MLAIIGGSGLTQLANLDVSRRQVVGTPYGEPSGALTFGGIRGVPVVFVARHGDGHTIPPHQVNYRANLWALKEQGAGEIVAVVSVGGIRADLGPEKIVVPHQIIDHTWGRMSTFFESEAPVKHIDFTEPYTGELRNKLLAAAKGCGEAAVDGAVYAATQRSEEHTSELQSLRHLVCRLLLEKKKMSFATMISAAPSCTRPPLGTPRRWRGRRLRFLP